LKATKPKQIVNALMVTVTGSDSTVVQGLKEHFEDAVHTIHDIDNGVFVVPLVDIAGLRAHHQLEIIGHIDGQ
jgi:hypothetical protein